MEASYARFESQVASEWKPMLTEEDSPYAIVEVEPQHTAAVKLGDRRAFYEARHHPPHGGGMVECARDGRTEARHRPVGVGSP